MSKGKTHNDIMHDMSANYAQKGQNYGGLNIDVLRRSSGNSGGDKAIVCQICFVSGHAAYKCKNSFNHDFVPRQARGNQCGFRPRVGQSFSENFERNPNNCGEGYNIIGYGRDFNNGFNGGFPRSGHFQGYTAFQASFIAS